MKTPTPQSPLTLKSLIGEGSGPGPISTNDSSKLYVDFWDDIFLITSIPSLNKLKWRLYRIQASRPVHPITS